MTLGEKLVILRKKNSLSQDELASAIRVSRQTVYKWESGKSAPDANNLIALKNTFGISIDNLLDESYVEVLPEKKKKVRISAEEKARIRARVLAEEGEAPEEAAVTVEEVAVPEETVAEEVAEVASEVEVSEAEAAEHEEEAASEEAAVPEEVGDEAKPDKKKVGFFGRLFGKK